MSLNCWRSVHDLRCKGGGSAVNSIFEATGQIICKSLSKDSCPCALQSFSPVQYPDIEGNFCFTDKLALGPTQQGTPTDIFLNNKKFKAALLSWFLYICRRLVLLCNILVLSLHWWHDLFLVCCNIQVYLEFFKVISLLICMQLERFEKGIKGKYQDYSLLGQKVNNT